MLLSASYSLHSKIVVLKTIDNKTEVIQSQLDGDEYFIHKKIDKYEVYRRKITRAEYVEIRQLVELFLQKKSKKKLLKKKQCKLDQLIKIDIREKNFGLNGKLCLKVHDEFTKMFLFDLNRILYRKKSP